MMYAGASECFTHASLWKACGKQTVAVKICEEAEKNQYDLRMLERNRLDLCVNMFHSHARRFFSLHQYDLSR